jgi:hypothetical protein
MAGAFLSSVSPGLAAALIIGVPTVLAGAGTVVARRAVKLPIREGHNEVMGGVLASISVIYAVVLAFLVFAVWEQFGNAERATTQEASLLISVARDAQTIPEPLRREIHDQLRRYAQLVLDEEWTTMARGQASVRARDALTALWASYEQLRPPVAYATERAVLADMSTQRSLRILDSQAALPYPFWLILILGGVVTIGGNILLYMEHVHSHAIMVALLTAVITSILWLLLIVEHPFAGGVRVSPESFQYALRVIDALPD